MRFRISDQPLELGSTPMERAGGFVTFEGRVRNHADGREVLALEYEAYVEMAEHQGEVLLEEAIQRFGLLEARAVHRVGKLAIGDVAVIVQTASAHRREAFEACEWIMDQLKWRVPIWKRETYVEGVSEWVGAGVAPSSIDDSQMFARQMVLPEVGLDGQQRLQHSRVLVVGAGGLAAGAVPPLVGAGIGTLGIIDPDVVEASNLHRQVLFAAADVGRLKAERIAAFAKRLRPAIQIHTYPARLSVENAARLVADYDWVLDCTDSLEAKFLLNQVCRSAGKCFVTSSIHQFEGQVLVVRPDGPCLQCLFPVVPPEECVGTCEQAGVLGVTPFLFGGLQASETIKGILGMPGLDQALLLWDLRTMETTQVRRRPNPDCPICHGGLLPQTTDWVIDQIPGGSLLVDIRGLDEEPRLRAPHIAVSMDACYGRDWNAPTVFVCASGQRSFHLVADLRAAGNPNVFSLRDGIHNKTIQDV